MKLKITDDDGFIALVNSATYQSFVDEDWQFDQLISHFVNQMNERNLIIWQTNDNGGGDWLVSFQEQQSTNRAFREFSQLINVTDGALYLTNYSDLTTAAQFYDSTIPAVHNADLKIELENGVYKFSVRQVVNPHDLDQDFETDGDESISFEIVIEPGTGFLTERIDNVHWVR